MILLRVLAIELLVVYGAWRVLELIVVHLLEASPTGGLIGLVLWFYATVHLAVRLAAPR